MRTTGSAFCEFFLNAFNFNYVRERDQTVEAYSSRGRTYVLNALTRFV